MAATAPTVEGHSYEEFVRMHAERFAAYLRGMLGHQAEGRGGRVPVDDTLQNALLAIYSEWPELQAVRDEERDRRMYRCLRDAAGQALRTELGRRNAATPRPQFVSLDRVMQTLEEDDGPARERELSAALLGAMVKDMASAEASRDERLTLDRGILVAGLRALTEREAVVLIAVDYLDWDQRELADHLGLGYSLVRQTLFVARKIFYTLVRHAVGLEVEDEERARLTAYMHGELKGADKREVRRHLQHCKSCQDLQREQRVFGRDALGVLAPLPFIFGARVLAKGSSAKAATFGSGAGTGLFAQAGAAKATATVMAFLTVGVGTSAVLAQLDQDRHARDPVAPRVVEPAGTSTQPAPGGMRRIAVPSSTATTSTSTTSAAARAPTKKHRASRSRPRRPSSSVSPSTARQSAVTQSSPTTSSAATSSSTKSSPKSSGGGCEFFGC
jgi:DNA-directed RNA polymerase specialized sigma24 family protein